MQSCTDDASLGLTFDIAGFPLLRFPQWETANIRIQKAFSYLFKKTPLSWG